MPTFQFDGQTVAYTEEGRGPAILLIPGLGGRYSFWREVVPRLAAGARTVSFDHPGSGGSAPLDGPCSVEHLSHIAAALLDHLFIDRATVLGHSMGGAVAQTMALDHADRVGALVLSSTWARPDAYFEKAFAQRRDILEWGGPAAYARAQTLAVLPADWIATNPAAAEDFQRDAEAGCHDTGALLRRIDSLLAFDRSRELAGIAIPTVVVHAPDDQVVPPHMSRELAGRIPDARLTVLDGGGHFAPLIAVGGFMEAIGSFVATARTTSAPPLDLLQGARLRARRAAMRQATVERKTKETQIAVTVDLDGSGAYDVATGIGFLDHMLEQLSRHSLIDLTVKAEGDLHIDFHHTTEDSGIAIGEAVAQALGDRAGIQRFGSALSPMDETLTRVTVDASNRPYLVWKVEFKRPKLGEMDTELFKEWFQAFAQAAGLTLHVEILYGENSHHIIESCYKGLARALRQAVEVDPRKGDAVPSTKGVLGGSL